MFPGLRESYRERCCNPYGARTFADVQLDGLQVNAAIEQDGRFSFNLAQLAERWSKGKPEIGRAKATT
jgi:hypothetical protein